MCNFNVAWEPPALLKQEDIFTHTHYGCKGKNMDGEHPYHNESC